MKKLVYTIAALLICSTAMPQEKPKEIKKETKVKAVKYKDSDSTKEGKIKVVTEEISNVQLDAKDANKINQSRISADKKVTKTVMIDNDADDAYDILTSETYYVSDNKNYKFSPNESGFMMALSDNQNEYVRIGTAWNTHNPTSYIVKGEAYNGIGYFEKDGSFVVEYYDEDSESIKTIKYKEKKNAM